MTNLIFPAMEIDQDEWNRNWVAVQNRLVPEIALPSVDSYVNWGFGKVISATISEVPLKYVERLYIGSELCPVCSQPTNRDTRLPANLSPTWESGLTVGASVWIHKTCFENLEITDRPPRIPW